MRASLPFFLFFLAGALASAPTFAAPTQGVSKALLQAEKTLRGWGCSPLRGASLESRGEGADAPVSKTNRPALAVGASGFCEPGKGAPGGGRALVAHQDGRGRVSLSDPFVALISVRLNPDGSITARGWKPHQDGQKDPGEFHYDPVNGRLRERPAR